MHDRYQHIYRHHPELYDRLVAREDQQGNLLAARNAIRRLDGLDVVEFGAGTGRLTRLLAVMVRQVHAFDIALPMLAVAKANMTASGGTNWALGGGDNERMPLAAACADVVIEGWSFAHVMEWQAREWRAAADAMLAEMARIVKPGGTMILIETLGTGQRQPQPPSPELARLYAYWQAQHGFHHRWIRSDYQFATPQEADELLRAFFGDELADSLLAEGRLRVPECTGIWWKPAPRA